MKKLLLIVVTVFVLCVTQSLGFSHVAQGSEKIAIPFSIDVIDVLNNPNQYENCEVVVYEDVQAYIDAVSQDKNLSDDTRAEMIAEAMHTPYSASTSYLTFKQKVFVSKGYYCYPYFYASCEFFGATPSSILEVTNAGIECNHDGKTKQFSGALFYNLETSSRLYWDLNGDFYNNGMTTVSGGGSTNLSKSANASFSIAHPSPEHFSYVCETGYVRI